MMTATPEQRPGIPFKRTVITRSEHETIDLGRELGATLTAGAVLLLEGGLGAGKTAFIRGVVAGLEADPDQVSSPTFTLIQEYRGRLRLYHVDLYRLTTAESDDLGLEELSGVDSVVAVEWADRLDRPIAGAIRITMTDLGNDEREITIVE